MSDLNAIEVKNVVKTFRIHHEKKSTVFDVLASTVYRKNSFEDLVVLDDVSFSVKKGEMLGIIGKNGSGKTTLLRLIAKIFKPNSGTIVTNGSIIPLLQLGAGFQYDLTARDNIILYGVILGFTQKDMRNKVDEVLKFAELEKFADTKLANFSSGMIARHAFATAVQADPDILIVDEVLSVGDAAFREKSYKAFLSFRERKKTILYVSHDISSVKEMCDRAMLLDKGKIQGIGPSSEVVNTYLKTTSSPTSTI